MITTIFRRKPVRALCLLVLTGLLSGQPGAVMGQAGDPEASADNVDEQAQLVEYPATFFQKYTPNTALDMVNQLPGFVLDDGDSSRGLGAAAGNVLINDRRPSAKQDLPSMILTRIPASLVERIEIIRGHVRDIDLQGQPALANIILKADSPAAIRWFASWEQKFDQKDAYDGSISLSDKWHDFDYNAGLDLGWHTRGDTTFQDTFDGEGVLTEKRYDDAFYGGYRTSANLNASKMAGATLVKFNTTLTVEDRNGSREIHRVPQPEGNGFRDESIGEDFNFYQIEVGADAERNLKEDFQGKIIGLYVYSDEDSTSPVLRTTSNGIQTLARNVVRRTLSTEVVGRMEFGWTKFAGHTIQANIETAFNALDGSLDRTDDTGSGPVEVKVPGANTRVEEVRWDYLLKDTWALGKYKLDYGMGAEASTISQTGDAEKKRNFFFLKPQGILTYSSDQGHQTRLRLAREVSQLDFSDFVSATVFEDDDVALGNPDLGPDSTWVAELAHERRFGPESVVKFLLFYNRITDVLDFLPITSKYEATGNIGNGKRYGIEVEATIPLEWVGLQGARLDVSARLQDSSVTDPVTGQKRPLSERIPVGKPFPLSFRNENKFALTVDYRQDFQAARFAWGWDVRTRAERPAYRVNELDIGNEGIEFNTFIETTRWFGLKMRASAENILDQAETRDRTGYAGERGLTPVEFREVRDRYKNFRVVLDVSGSF